MTPARTASKGLPDGVVTFLFTDVEGSTRLVQRLGDDYPVALEAHNRLIRAALSEHDGVEVVTTGDGFFAAFADADHALAAAIQAQHALASHEWPQGAKVAVRMGIHTGKPTVVDDDYVGIDVHRAARIAAATHGRQLVVSQTPDPSLVRLSSKTSAFIG